MMGLLSSHIFLRVTVMVEAAHVETIFFFVLSRDTLAIKHMHFESLIFPQQNVICL